MRQAGRSLPEYRAVRKRFTLFEICRQPELCADVTLQPVRRHGVDAAVLFADIMLPVLGMGVDVELVEGVGPVVARPIETWADVEALRVPEPAEAVPYVLETVRLVREQLEPSRRWSASAAGRSRSRATSSRGSRRASSRRRRRSCTARRTSGTP
jgi:uroporphyrinogen decarboxylase